MGGGGGGGGKKWGKLCGMSGGSYVDGRNWWSVLKLRDGNLPTYLKMQLGRHYRWK
jgi:hypothetical protein